MTITVYGSPAPQGSKRFVGVKGGHGVMIESSKAVKPWREAVKCAAIDVMIVNEPRSPLSCPLNVHMIFTVPKPKSAPKSRRTWPDRKPDLDKLCRSTIDALTDAGVWEDDARIVKLNAKKCYPSEETGSLSTPGAVIQIEEYKE